VPAGAAHPGTGAAAATGSVLLQSFIWFFTGRNTIVTASGHAVNEFTGYRSWGARVNGTPRLEGMHAATASAIGWIDARPGGGPECLFCGNPAGAFKPLDKGWLTTLERLWWCRPCETTWVA
jgi:hypothetical protein